MAHLEDRCGTALIVAVDPGVSLTLEGRTTLRRWICDALRPGTAVVAAKQTERHFMLGHKRQPAFAMVGENHRTAGITRDDFEIGPVRSAIFAEGNDWLNRHRPFGGSTSRLQRMAISPLSIWIRPKGSVFTDSGYFRT